MSLRLHVVATYFREFRRHFYGRAGEAASAHQLLAARSDWMADVVEFGANSNVSVSFQIANDPISQIRRALEHDTALDLHDRRRCEIKLRDKTLWNRLSWLPEEREMAQRIAFSLLAASEPDIVLFTNAFFPSQSFRGRVQERGIKVAIQCTQPLDHLAVLWPHDVVLTVSPKMLSRYRQWGYWAELFTYGFNPRILARLGSQVRKSRLVFVGQMSSNHKMRRTILSALAEHLPVDWYGPERDRDGAPEPLRSCYRGEVFGLDMYRVLAGCSVGWNCPPDFEPDLFGMFRTFEVMGLGVPLVTLAGSHQQPRLRAGEHYASFTDYQQAHDVCDSLLRDPEAAAELGARAQQVVLQHFASDTAVRNMCETMRSALAL